LKRTFQNAAQWASRASGTPWAFMCAAGLVLVWALTGPIFDFSDTWQLVINTGTTVVTFLMVFLIQNTQNRDTVALHAKVDELIIKLEGPDNQLVEAEDMSDEALAQLMVDKKQQAMDEANPSARAEAVHTAEHAEDELERRGQSPATIAPAPAADESRRKTA
jgi:low affinity Fe/Cu permease